MDKTYEFLNRTGGQLPVSRRSFLKSSIVAGGALALAGCGTTSDGESIYITPSQEIDTSVEKLVDSACRGNCAGHQCRLYAHVRKGRVVKTSMAPMIDPRYNRACLRGLSHVQRIYGPERLLYPLKRKAGTLRGNPTWERITWNEAITAIAAKFKANIDNSSLGKRSNMYISSTGNYGSIHGISGAPALLFNAIEGTAISGIFDISIPVGMERVLGTTTFPFAQNNETMGLLKSKTIIIWGQNTSESQNQFFYTIMDAKEQNGAKVIAIDPAFTTSVAKANHHVNLRAASDPYFALSMIQHIIAQDWVDYDFMTKNTVSPFLVNLDPTHPNYKDYLRYSHLSTADKTTLGAMSDDTLFAVNAAGALVPTTKNTSLGDKTTLPAGNYNHVYNGNLTSLGLTGDIPVKTTFLLLKEHVQQYTPELTATHTGVSADVTKEVARQYANNKPASIIPGFGAGHYGNGHHLGHALATLAAITGNFGKEGAGIGWFGSAAFVNGLTTVATHTPAGPNTGNVASAIPYIHFDKVFDAPLSTSTSTAQTFGGPDELFKNVPHKLRALYIASANPVNNWCEQKKMVDVLTKPGTGGAEYKVELVVVADMVMTDTAMYADIVLPVAHWFEVEDFLNTTPYIHYQEKAVEPLGEAKSDLDICREIANKMGDEYGKFFKMTNEQFFDYALTSSSYIAYYKAITGNKEPYQDNIPNAANLRKNKVMRALPGDSLNSYVTPPFRNGDDLVVGTNNAAVTGNTKRMEFYSEKIYCFNTYGQDGLSSNPLLPLFVDSTIMDEERLPMFKEPLETWPTNANFAEYPLSYYQEHTRFRTHSQLFSVPWIKEIDPYPTLKISKTDAVKYGNIQTGDIVKVSSPRGYVVLKAVLTDGLRPGYVNIPKGWQELQYEQIYGEAARKAGLANAGSYQNLTSLKVNPRSINQSFFDCLVKVEKLGA